MICNVCKKRYASFPDEDFASSLSGNILPLNDGANKRRAKIFESDEVGVCGPACEKVLDIMALMPLTSDA